MKNTHTRPSRKAHHNVYLEDNGCILEVRRKDKYFIYEVHSNGESSLIIESLSPYTPEMGKSAEEYYLDYLDIPCLQKIDLLASTFDYQETIHGLKMALLEVSKEDYSMSHFNMDMSNTFEDYKQVLQQLVEFTSEKEYSTRLNHVSKFFEDNFYNRINELSEPDLETIKTTIFSEISFLEGMSSN